MMKGRWTYMLFAMLILFGCVDKSYGGMEEEVIYDDLTEPIPVKIHIGKAETIVPKGTGVIPDVSAWGGVNFYVYAFNKDMLSTFDVTSKENSSQCLIDGSKDLPGALTGKLARMHPTSNVVEWLGPDSEVYYPFGSESGIVYDFFAYYTDDSYKDGPVVREATRIMLPVEIDGTQDLMSAKAGIIAEQLKGFPEGEVDKELMEQYCYSYYAARKGIDPVFVFKHHLTKLDFSLTPQHNPTGSRTVHVDSIKVMTRYRGMFTVADKSNADNLGLNFEDEYTGLPLRDENPEGGYMDMQPGKYSIVTLESQGGANQTPIGASMLIAPDESYTAYAYLSETFPNGARHEYPEPIKMDLRNPGGFLPGNAYSVNISVYGATQITFQVVLEKWNDGGKVEIDNEDAFGNNGEY